MRQRLGSGREWRGLGWSGRLFNGLGGRLFFLIFAELIAAGEKPLKEPRDRVFMGAVFFKPF